MTKQEVINLMESSRSEKEWNENADTVKEAFNGYPDFWWSTIIQSGLVSLMTSKPGFYDSI